MKALWDRSDFVLLRTLFLSTSLRNQYKYCKDRRKRKKIRGAIVGMALLYAMLIGYSFATCIGYGLAGLIDAVPVTCALTICSLAFIMAFFRSNGYLFNFKEYDMLMSLPFEPGKVAACRFLFLYGRLLPWFLSIVLASMVGYGMYAKPSVLVYPLWILLSLLLPVIPMLAAAFLGFLITRASVGFKKKNLIQTILTFAFVFFCFTIRFFLEMLFKDEQVGETMENFSNAMSGAAQFYPPAGWFADVILRYNWLELLLLAGTSILLFALVFAFVGKSYRQINSAMKSHAKARHAGLEVGRQRSVVAAVAYKEWRRMSGSTTYMVNCGIGLLLAVVIGILSCIIGFDKIVALVTNNAPFDPAILYPAIPLICYFVVGMLATTACSPSLEGKNYWIVQSLPIETKVLYQGKMLFNLCLTVPFMLFAILCICVSARVPLVDTLLYLVLGAVLCAFSTAWGCVCGIRHMRLDWENEVEVIKQGAATAIYLLPNMFAVMGLTVLVVFLGTKMDHRLLALAQVLVVLLLALLSYHRVLVLTAKPESQKKKRS